MCYRRTGIVCEFLKLRGILEITKYKHLKHILLCKIHGPNPLFKHAFWVVMTKFMLRMINFKTCPTVYKEYGGIFHTRDNYVT